MTYLTLFLTFLKIGAFTFGGGYAMLPLIREEVAAHGWLTEQALIDFVAVSESTPGPFAINIATFVGSRVGGVFGSVCATGGVVLPSFLIILALSYLLKAFQEFRPVAYAFRGVRAGVLALILKAIWTMWKPVPKKLFSYLVIAAAFVCVAVFDVHVVIVIVGCALAGLAYTLLTERRRAQ